MSSGGRIFRIARKRNLAGSIDQVPQSVYSCGRKSFFYVRFFSHGQNVQNRADGSARRVFFGKRQVKKTLRRNGDGRLFAVRCFPRPSRTMTDGEREANRRLVGDDIRLFQACRTIDAAFNLPPALRSIRFFFPECVEFHRKALDCVLPLPGGKPEKPGTSARRRPCRLTRSSRQCNRDPFTGSARRTAT